MKKTRGFFDLIFGKMDKGTPSHQLEENELSDSKNMQPTRAGWIQRKGISELTTTSIDTGVEIKNAIHFQQLNLDADEIIAHAYDSVNGERILRQTTLPPATHTGASWEELKTLTAGCDVAQFAIVGDALVMANNKEFQIYRGPSQKPYGVYFYDDGNTAYIDWYDELTDDDAATVMILDSMTSSDYIYVISLQPIIKVTPTVSAPNGTAGGLIGEYYNGSWIELLDSMGILSDASYNSWDCSDISGWVDEDSGDGVSDQTTFDGRSVFSFDNGSAGAGNDAERKEEVTGGGGFGVRATATIRVYCSDIGAQADGDVFNIEFDDGATACRIQLAIDGIFVDDGAAWNEVGTDLVVEDTWQEWTFDINWTAKTVDIYLDGIQVGNDVDCSRTAFSVTGQIGLRQDGDTTANRKSYVDMIRAGTGLTTGHGFTDGTVLSNATFGQTGDIEWMAPGDDVKTFIQGQHGYAYRFKPQVTMDAEVEVSAMTVYAPWNDIKNIWAGEYITCIGCLVTEGSEYEDYTGKVNNDFVSDVCVLDALTTANGLWYLAFAEPVSTIQIYMVVGKGNDNAALTTVKYAKNDGTWSSGFTVAGGTLEDTCIVGGDAIKQSGYLRWTPPSDEKPTIVGGELIPKFWYQISFSQNLDAEVEVFYLEGVPALEDPDFSAGVFAFKRRAVQIAPKGIKNALRYSAANLPNVFNGNDSGYMFFGERPLKAATHFFNEGLVFADTEMWFIQGSVPANFGTLRLSAQVGIDAPLSLIGVEIGVMVGTGAAAIQRKIICWVFRGLWMFDGIRWWKISSPDIDNFFDPDHADYINTTYANRTFGAFDFETELCYWIFYSGSGQTTPNKVVVFHPITLWYGIYEYDQDISCILSVANGLRSYLCAGGHSSSKLYQMNNTNTDVDATGTAVAIEAFVITRDIWNAYDQALKERLLYLGMEAQDTGQVKVYGFPDGSKTEQEIGTMSMIERGKDISNKHIKVTKNWPGEHTVKLKFLNETSGIRWRPYSAKLNWDPAEPDSK
jgi:hypothetical protein